MYRKLLAIVTMMSPRRRTLRGALKVTLCLVAGLAILRIARADVSAMDRSAWTIRPGRLLAGTLVEVALLAWGVALWSLVLSRFDGPRPPFGAMLRAWFGTNLAKYVPGGIWPVVTTAAMASRMGVCPLALSASFLLHATFTVLGALAVAAVLVSPAQLRSGGIPLAGVAVLLPLALLLVHPRVLGRLLAGAARLARREAAPWRGRWMDGVGLLALYAATWIGYGYAFFLFVSSITAVRGGTWPLLAGVNALAFVAGFVVVFAPGGIGVREAALAALLLPVVPGRGRLVVAASSRLWLVGTELLGGGLALMVPGRAFRGAPRWKLPRPGPSRPALPPVPAAPPPPGVTRGNDVEVLTNTGEALGRIAAACRRAERSVWIAQLAFDADCLSAAEDEDGGALLVDALLAAARGENGGRGAEVRILLNGSILMNTAPALRRHFAEAGADPARLAVRGVDRFPGIMHAKLVVVDGAEAFLVGSPFVNGYWDDGAHRASQPGRTEEDLGGRPIHDLSAHVRGPAVADLAEWFAEVWNGTPAGPDAPAPPLVPSPAARVHEAGGTSVRVVRTLPPRAVPSRADGATEILDAYVDAIGRARSLIYLENQYFSAPPIRRALSAALEARPELEVVLVVNQNPDITAYRAWQNRRMAEGGLLDHPRVGVFSLWAAASRPGARGVELTQLFIHSKTAVVDDAWATFGTANLDGVSLDSYGDDFSARPWRRLFRGIRNFDLNLVLLSGAEGEVDSGAAATLRGRLWAGHLGMDEEALKERPEGGWLALWRAAAAENAARLARGEVPRGHVLPYATAPRPRDQLRSLGIDVRSAEIDLRFDPGWVEVLWSPGWMKKIIPEPVRRRFARKDARRPELPRGRRGEKSLGVVPVPVAERIRADFEAFVGDPAFSCLGARAALNHDAWGFGAYAGMGSPRATRALARDLAAFARANAGKDFSTFVAVFVDAPPADEAGFEGRLWAQLRALHASDPVRGWDPAVSDDPSDPRFAFSFAGHAFFVVGMHPESSRLARRFGWPVLVFNPHAQFERLREDGRYGRLREAIRAREMALQGSLNPNLADFGAESAARQYSGRVVEADWACPFHRENAEDPAARREPGVVAGGSPPPAGARDSGPDVKTLIQSVV